MDGTCGGMSSQSPNHMRAGRLEPPSGARWRCEPEGVARQTASATACSDGRLEGSTAPGVLTRTGEEVSYLMEQTGPGQYSRKVPTAKSGPYWEGTYL